MSDALSDDDRELVIKALNHYNAYLLATRREDGRYQELLERLQRKPPEQEQGKKAATKKRA
jgi:hypothetical protein